MTIWYWLPLSLLSFGVIVLVVILRHRKYVEIRAFPFRITFGDTPPDTKPNKPKGMEGSGAPIGSSILSSAARTSSSSNGDGTPKKSDEQLPNPSEAQMP
jgi:hypothetical protein